MRAFDNILLELDWPAIYLVSARQFEKIDGDKLRGNYGIANSFYCIITINKGLKGKVLINTLWHEVGHILYPQWEEWRIEAFAERMARGGGKGDFCKKYGHSVDELPPRKELLKWAKRAAIRHNKRYQIAVDVFKGLRGQRSLV